MGMGQFFQGLDERIVAQANERANNARTRAISDIKASMIENPGDPAHTAYYGGEAANKSQATAMEQPDRGDRYDAQYLAAATAMRDAQGVGPIEGLNLAMAENPYARYGVAGTAALGGGVAMTAGAQKLLGLMGILEEAGETEVARDMPLQS